MKKPNIIVIITDDQGYGDLSCMGATDFRTPYLDRLAGDGVRMTDFYANSPVCSPSRAALLTGKYPIHAGVRSILTGGRKTTGLSAQVPTMPALLKQNGYQTAMFGKWHLGLTDDSRPSSHGFDEWFGFLAGCIDFYSHIYYWELNSGGPLNTQTHDLWHNDQEIWRNGEYFTELITEHAVKYVREAAKSDQPFFMYLPYNAPHYPMHAPQKYMDRFAHMPWDRQVMAAMVSAVDDSIGDIIAELERQGAYDDTLIFFMSDNGPSREARNWLDGNPDPYYGGTTGQLKGHKGSLFEGGVRVPGIMSWKNGIPGGQVIDTPIAAMDVLPTLLGAIGADVPAENFDGTNLLDMLTNSTAPPERDLFWEFLDQTSVRRGKWKLTLNGTLVENVPPEDSVFLADLDADMAEQHNLKDEKPDIAKELTETAQQWRQRMDDYWDDTWASRMTGPMLVPD